MQEALRLKVELDSIYEAIERTKREIATLRYAGAQGQEITRVTDELGAIVLGTETATNSILAAAEKIDDLSSNLSSRLSGSDQDIAREILDQVISIFEACNFQDITGQRISKVVNAMRFVEERVHHMIEIWGGLESFKDVEAIDDHKRRGDAALLNGPALSTDKGVTSQDDMMRCSAEAESGTDAAALLRVCQTLNGLYNRASRVMSLDWSRAAS
jgi:chemotaxis protein CheZ